MNMFHWIRWKCWRSSWNRLLDEKEGMTKKHLRNWSNFHNFLIRLFRPFFLGCEQRKSESNARSIGNWGEWTETRGSVSKFDGNSSTSSDTIKLCIIDVVLVFCICTSVWFRILKKISFAGRCFRRTFTSAIQFWDPIQSMKAIWFRPSVQEVVRLMTRYLHGMGYLSYVNWLLY